jgi:hypothetical protein
MFDFDIVNSVLKKYHGNGGDVVIPDGVTAISVQAFYGCESLTDITIPGSVINICEGAFDECSKSIKA